MRIIDPFNFVCEVVKELGKADFNNLNPETITKLEHLMDAANNITIYQKGLESGVLPLEAISTLCKLIPLQPISDIDTLTGYVFSIFVEGCKDSKQAVLLLEVNEFVRPMLYHLSKLSDERMVKRFMSCLEVINNHKECDMLLVIKGVIIVLLKMIFNESYTRSHRVLAFKVVQSTLVRQKSEERIKSFTCFMPAVMLERIVEQLSTKEEDWIDILCTDRSDIYLTWDKPLREKIGEFLAEEVNSIEQWVSSNEQPLWIDLPKVPKIQQFVNKGDMTISDIVLSRYISFPCIKLRKPINNFLEVLNEEIMVSLSILNHHLILKESGVKELLELAEEVKTSLQEHIINLEKGVLSMSVALLLTCEQLFKNLFNPNKTGSEAPQKKFKSTAISRNVMKTMLYNGLRSTICREINITLLQLLCLVCEHKDLLGKDELQVITVAVTQRLLDCSKASDNLRNVEEIATVYAILKIMEWIGSIKERDPIIDLIINKEILDRLKELYETRKHLMNFIEVLLHKVAQAPYYLKYLNDVLKFELSEDCRMDKILNRKYERIDKIWRKPPTKLEECKSYENFSIMESFNPNTGIDYVMPIISKKVFDKIDFQSASEAMEEMYKEEFRDIKARTSDPIKRTKSAV